MQMRGMQRWQNGTAVGKANIALLYGSRV